MKTPEQLKDSLDACFEKMSCATCDYDIGSAKCLADMCRDAKAYIEQLWISVEERLPEAEKEVLAVCRRRSGLSFVVPAIYENGEVTTDDSNWHWYDHDFPYDEDEDVYIIPEGWWENRRFNPDDVFNCPIDCPVTHWMPLPPTP